MRVRSGRPFHFPAVMTAFRPALALLLLVPAAAGQRTVANLNIGWKFQEDGGAGPAPVCNDANKTFPVSRDGVQCLGLAQNPATTYEECQDACCSFTDCDVFQWCDANTSCVASGSPGQCWMGASGQCQQSSHPWRGRSRPPAPPAPPAPAGACSDPRCAPGTDDSKWRTVSIPHDFVVEHNFSASGDKSHGYLPYGIGWYRKHFTPPASLQAASTIYLDLDGVQTSSQVWLNGAALGEWGYGYTGSRYHLNSSQLKWGEENLLAVRVDATKPDGWWYDGGGIYRHVRLTAILTPGPVIAPWGVYAPSNVTGPISWDADGNPSADSSLTPSVEVWNNASSPAAQKFSVSLKVTDATGKVVATSDGSGSVAGRGGISMWTPKSPIALPAAKLWHTVAAPLKPALYTLLTEVAVGGRIVDSTSVTFGVRATYWSAATGFWLNGVNTKILGNANHQDFAAVGVAVPDHLQWYRVWKQQQFGSNGWRTAHNPPTPALLDACDELGFLVWDENHRNGQLDQVPLIIKRDRNHPSVVIWSICNEVLCKTNDWINDALAMKKLMHQLDPRGGRPVSANQNGWVGPTTPLDVQGFDYSTQTYDKWHKEAPTIPSISSETSSAVGDRGEYANDQAGGHVSGYDNQHPGWGENAETAWGGVGESDGQGILTRPFISGGWTWTGWDYRGEPTPYAWPDVNSHFGILDLCGFEKDRTYWYAPATCAA